MPFIFPHSTALSVNLGNGPISACSNKRTDLLVIILLNDGSDEATNGDTVCFDLLAMNRSESVLQMADTVGSASRHAAGTRDLLQHLYSICLLTYEYLSTYLLHTYLPT